MKKNGKIFRQNEQEWLGYSFDKTKPDRKSIAETYFRLVAAYNKLPLSEGDINFLSHVAINNGNVSGSKRSFVEKYGSTMSAVDNMISKLKKMWLLTKTDTTVHINPKLLLDFNSTDNFIFSFKCRLTEESRSGK